MVRTLLLLFTLVTLSPLSAHAQSVLLLEMDKNEIEFGQSFVAGLYAVNSKQKINNIDLSLLEKDFKVERLNDGEVIDDPRWPGQNIQYLRFRLYPFAKGEYWLPEFKLGEMYSNPFSLNVVAATRNNVEVVFDTQISNPSPWQRQQVKIIVDIYTSDKFALLNIDETFSQAGFEVRTITQQRETLHEPVNGNISRIQTGWLVFPLLSGSQQLKLPAINYRVDGVRLKTFYLPDIVLNVKSLPPYVPPTMPVGKVSLKSGLSSTSFWQTDTLAFWRLELTANAVLAEWLPPMLRQIKTSGAIRFLPAESQRGSFADLTGIHGKAIHRIPLKPLSNGRLAIPEIRLQYFDPDSGRLVAVYHQADSPWVLDLFWRIVLLLLGLLGILYLGKCLLNYWRNFLLRYRKRKLAMQQIQRAKDGAGLRLGLSMLAESERWRTNQPLQSWAADWNESYPASEGVDAFVRGLSATCYRHRNRQDVAGLQQQLLSLIKSTGQRWLWRMLRPQ